MEFSVVNPTQQKYAQPASIKHLVAADDREEEKRAKYAKPLGPLNVRTVWAAAMETTGAFGKGLQSLSLSAQLRAFDSMLAFSS